QHPGDQRGRPRAVPAPRFRAPARGARGAELRVRARVSTRRRTGGRSTRPLVLLPLLGALLVALAPTAWSQTSGPDQVSDDTPDDGPALRLVEASPWLDPDGSIVVTVEIPPGLPDDATV